MATNPTTTLPKLNIGSQPTLNMSGTPDYTSFFNPESISEQQYLGSGVDFYTQTLGTGIKSTVAEEEKPEEKVEDTRPDIFKPIGSDGGDDKQQIASDISRELTIGLDTTKLFSASELNPQSFSYNEKTGNVDATSYKGGTAGKTVKQKGDLVGDFFSNFASNLGAINAEQLKGVASPFDALGKTPTLTSPTGKVSAMGLPPAATMALGPSGAFFGALASIGGAANMALAQQTAAKIKAMGGGAFMENGGLMLYRAPGSTMYSGTLVGNSQKMSGYLEAMQRGFVRGTMVIEEFDPKTGKMIKDVSGTKDVIGRNDLIGSKGGFTETGAWMDLAGNTSTGTVAKQTEAYTAGVNKNFGLSGQYAITKAEIMGLRNKVNTSWSFTKGTHVPRGSKTYQDLVRDLASSKLAEQAKDGLGYTRTDYSNIDKSKFDSNKRSEDLDAAQAKKDSGYKEGPPGKSGPTESQKDDNKSDSSSSGSSKSDNSDKEGQGSASSGVSDGPSDTDSTGGRAWASGGRVGYQEGGEAGFAQRPEFVGGNQTQPDGVSVADDQPRDVQEGTFVINAAAADFAGRGDIEKMLRDAYKRVGDTGQSGVSQEVQIAVSKGEVIIPPHIAKEIGYDRLNKINNRGKKEIARRQEAAGGGFIDRKKYAKGDMVLPKSKPKKTNQAALGDVELRADMEEFIQTDPLARLGWNLYEKGDLDIKAIVLPANRKVSVGIGGVYTPKGERRDPGSTSRKFEGFAEQQGVTKQNRNVAGIHYFAGENVNYGRHDATITLLHELRHHAMRHISNKYKTALPELSREESLFDAQDYANRLQARKVKPSIPKEMKEKDAEVRQRHMYMSPSANKEIAMYQSVAEEVLKDRKVPPRTKSKEVEGFFTRAMGLLGL
jgi:hypothetical protein